MTANALYLLATRGGDLSVVAPIAALYPVTTVILALIVDHERLRGIQVAGLLFAVAALVLVSSNQITLLPAALGTPVASQRR